MNIPGEIKIVEVGPRDGLQNETQIISLENKVRLINLLSDSGISAIETGSFVSSKWVPQMAQTSEDFGSIQRYPGVSYSALTPNLRGLHDAIEARVEEVAVFAASTESFSKKNINCSIDDSLDTFSKVCKKAKEKGIKVRGYLSCVFGCPYEGDVKIEKVLQVASRLIEIGCYEVSLGDTIGTGTPIKAKELVNCLKNTIPAKRLAVHFHDTFGLGLANILSVIEEGIHTVDSAVSGLGGCPYAEGASGNVATEDVLYMLDSMGIKTSINLNKVLEASWFIADVLGRDPISKVARALKSRRK